MDQRVSLILVESSWVGHHPVWFKEYVNAALSLGWNVLAVCPNPEEIDIPEGCACRLVRERFLVGKTGVSKLPGQTHRIIYWWHVARHLRRYKHDAETMGWNNFRVFFASIYDDVFQWFPLGERFLRIPWSGLHMSSRSFYLRGTRPAIDRPERLFRNPRCTGVAVLDETIVPLFKHRLRNREVVVFPDISDPSLPEGPVAQARRIREFAAGRKVIGLLGHLIPRKGVLDFLGVAQALSAESFCFVLAGDLSEWLYEPDTLAFLKEAGEGKVPNVLGIYGKIECQTVYNSIVDACDILFAAYRNFPNSSNTLTKAAQMRKPVIVSKGYVMAERVNRHGLGLTVTEGDAGAIINAIRRLVACESPIDSDGASMLVEAHSITHLPDCFHNVLKADGCQKRRSIRSPFKI